MKSVFTFYWTLFLQKRGKRKICLFNVAGLILSLDDHAGSMTSWRFAVPLFLCVLQSTIDLSKEGISDYVEGDNTWAKNLTHQIPLIESNDVKHMITCAFQEYCATGQSDVACHISSNERWGNCTGKTNKSIPLFHLMCLYAKLKEKEEGNESPPAVCGDYDYVYKIYRDISNYLTPTTTTAATTLLPTTTKTTTTPLPTTTKTLLPTKTTTSLPTTTKTSLPTITTTTSLPTTTKTLLPTTTTTTSLQTTTKTLLQTTTTTTSLTTMALRKTTLSIANRLKAATNTTKVNATHMIQMGSQTDNHEKSMKIYFLLSLLLNFALIAFGLYTKFKHRREYLTQQRDSGTFEGITLNNYTGTEHQPSMALGSENTHDEESNHLMQHCCHIVSMSPSDVSEDPTHNRNQRLDGSHRHGRRLSI